MSLMIIGADHLGNIKENIKKLGFTDITHLPGHKKNKFRSFRLPIDIDMVVVLTNYINHKAMKVVKREAKEKNVDLLFAKRGWSFIYKKLERRMVIN